MGSLVNKEKRKSKQSRSREGESRLFVAFCSIAFALGYFVRPSSVTNGRVALIFFPQVMGCSSYSNWLQLDFPVKIYTVIYHSLPFKLDSIAAWDQLIFLIGLITLFGMAVFFSSRWNYSLSQIAFFLAAYVLCGIYIFIFNKDVIQFFIFLLAFWVSGLSIRDSRRIALISLIFILEAFVWRQYYVVLALFLPLFYFLIKRTGDDSKRFRSLIKMLAIVFLAAALFLVILKIVSIGNYATIVGKHAVERESYTAPSAVSGIASWLSVTPASPIPIIVCNWFLNFVRLLFPVELFALGPYYWLFAIYQLVLSCSALRIVLNPSKLSNLDKRGRISLALFFAFVICSALFEPDFGSWVRHETASLPFLMYMFSSSGSNRFSSLPNYEKV